MKLIALLSFFDERPDWLSACVASLASCCDHVVAVDGAYRLFPQARAHSGDVQAGAVVGTAQNVGLGVTYQAPSVPWEGNEVEKRNRLFELGMTVAESDRDWFLVVDADMIVTSASSDLKQRLSETEHHVGTYWVTEDFEGGSGRYPARFLFRAHPSLHLKTTHFGYWRDTEFGEEFLWETGGLPACETDLVIEHRRHNRHPDRFKRAERYYLLRDEYGIETKAVAERQGDDPMAAVPAQG